jgi:hypothetical protein
MRDSGGEEVVSCAHKGGGKGPRLCSGVLGMVLTLIGLGTPQSERFGEFWAGSKLLT